METVTRAQGKKQSKETDSKSAHMLGLAKTSKQIVYNKCVQRIK